MFFKSFLFEPHPRLFEEIKKNRTEDNVVKLEIALGNENIDVILYEGKEGPLSDYAHTTYNVESNYGINVGTKYTVKMRTLSNIVQKYSIKKNPLLMSIDTEGTDFQVILGNDFKILKPIIIITEWHSCSSLIGSRYLDTKDENLKKHKLLVKNDYIFCKRFGCNDVYFKRPYLYKGTSPLPDFNKNYYPKLTKKLL